MFRQSLSQKHYRLPVVVGLVFIMGIGAVSDAKDLSIDQIIAKTDEAMTKAKDQYFEYDLVTKEQGKKPRVLRFAVTIKGDKKRFIEFLSPGDVKGMKFLVLDVDKMYVYLPAFRKVRRVASHVRAQGFMGSAYTQEVMALTKFGEVFSGKLLDQDDKEWRVEFTLKKGKVFSYPKLIVKIRKDIFQPTLIEYYNAKGAKLLTEKREGWQCADGLCNPRKMSMVDHSRGDMESFMIQRAWKHNTGVDDRLFSVRSLQRRR